MLTLLTATGVRPQAWAVCERLMAAQTYVGPVRWVIVDDGEEAQPITFSRDGWQLDVIRPRPAWQPGQNTQARNLLAGLKHIDAAERVVVIEDDDWYHPTWLAHADTMLDAAELIGECRARYYNLSQRKARQLSNTKHASLCSSAMRGRVLGVFRKLCEQAGRQFIDLELWARCKPMSKLADSQLVVGIKGLPGRGGIGMGHRAEFNGTPDPDGALLRLWVGKDAELYL